MLMDLFSAGNLIAAYSVLIGLMMIGMWLHLLLTNQMPELHKTKTKHISLHLIDEFLTALLLIISGVGLSLRGEWARTLMPIALGVLLYTTIVSAGKYADEDNLPMVTMFGVITILTLIAIAGLFISIQG